MIMTDTRYSPLETIVLLTRARAELVRDVDRAVSGHGVGFSDLMLLRQLAAAPDNRMRRSDLAHQLGVTTSNVARQLGPLERIGVVARESNPKDARLALVVLTESGERIVREASAIAEERAAVLLDRSWSGDEQAQLGALLDLVVR